jgi:3-hydroxyisobutyrate dehydrogenase-like beta-hydroxyacid dehydrogenase
MSSVTDDAALEAVMFGSQGALAGAQQGAIIIDTSSVSPTASRHLFDAAREKGVQMIDAADSGSVPQVDDGSLVIFVGGEQRTYDACKSILNALGKETFYMGPSGMGSNMKLVVNTLLGLGLQALGEALALGEKSGLRRTQLMEVLKQTSVISPVRKLPLRVQSGGNILQIFLFH